MKFTEQSPPRIHLPRSKSYLNRLLILQAIANTSLSEPTAEDGTDVQALYRALSAGGQHYHAGEGGTTARFLMAWLGTQPGTWHLDAAEPMRKRPTQPLCEALESLGADFTFMHESFQLPAIIRGINPKQNTIVLNPQESSQFASALMLVASRFPEPLTIQFNREPVSQSYIHMTVRLLQKCGVTATFNGTSVAVSNIKPNPAQLTPEKDWSAAAMILVHQIVSRTPVIEVPGLHVANSVQGDSEIVDYLSPWGLETEALEEGTRFYLKPDMRPSHFSANLVHTPDLAQPLSVLCALTGVPAHLHQLQSLRYKETNRLEALCHELPKIGAHAGATNSHTLWIEPMRNKPVEFTEVLTYNDHRMAMAFAAAKYNNPEIKIQSPEVVDKSFPKFWDEVAKLQAHRPSFSPSK